MRRLADQAEFFDFAMLIQEGKQSVAGRYGPVASSQFQMRIRVVVIRAPLHSDQPCPVTERLDDSAEIALLSRLPGDIQFGVMVAGNAHVDVLAVSRAINWQTR